MAVAFFFLFAFSFSFFLFGREVQGEERIERNQRSCADLAKMYRYTAYNLLEERKTVSAIRWESGDEREKVFSHEMLEIFGVARIELRSKYNDGVRCEDLTNS